MRILAAFRASKREPLLQVSKSAIAIAASWILTVFILGTPLPIFAAIAALLVVQPSVNQSFAKGIERSIGVIIGVVVATLVGFVLGSASWVVLVAIALALAIGWALKITAGTSNQVAISAMLVLALGATSPTYSIDRIIETFIGAAMGIVVNALIVPPVLVKPARDKLRLLGSEIAGSLVRLADALESRPTPGELQSLMIEARLLRPMRDAAETAITDGLESLTLNPRRSRHRDDLMAMQELLEGRLNPIVTQVVGMSRAYIDRYDDTLCDEPAAIAIAEELRRAAHDVRLAVHIADVEPEPMTSAIPALTAPLDLSSPKSGHWILIGSLMEDLRRIRDELLSDAPLVDLADGAAGDIRSSDAWSTDASDTSEGDRERRRERWRRWLRRWRTRRGPDHE